jgi:hypothetical protein
MIQHETSAPALQPRLHDSSTRLGASLRAFAAGVGAWFATGSDYYRAAALYEELSSLAGAERAGRRMARAALARELCNACDRSEASRAASPAGDLTRPR